MIEINLGAWAASAMTGYSSSWWEYTWHEECEINPIKQQLFAQMMGWT